MANCAFRALGVTGNPLLHPEECRRKAEEADELAKKSKDSSARLAYEQIARIWREMAERGERNKW